MRRLLCKRVLVCVCECACVCAGRVGGLMCVVHVNMFVGLNMFAHVKHFVLYV